MLHLSVLYHYRILCSPSLYTSPSLSPCSVLSHLLLRRIIEGIHRCHFSFLHTLIKRDDEASVFLPDNDVFIHLYWIKNCPSLALLKRSHVIIIKKIKETCRHRISMDRNPEAGTTSEDDLPIYCMFEHVP